MFRTLLLIATLAFATHGSAGEFNPVLSPGDTGPSWDALPGTDGQSYSSDHFNDADVLVIVFTCNSCPYAVDYEDRLNAFHKEFCQPEQKVRLIAINSNKAEEDSLEAMKTRAKEKSFAFPYVFDESQTVAREYGALRTPEFVVLNKERKVVYLGAMDDNTDSASVTKHYVEDAVTATLNRTEVATTETPPVGCSIRFERKRRGR